MRDTISFVWRVSGHLLLPFLMLLSGPQTAVGQYQDYPEINKNVPEFVLNNVENSKTSTISSEDLEGKYYILDFWATSCGTCVSSFPKMNEIQEQYKEKIKIILVGLEEKNRDVKKFYNIYKNRFRLNLTSSYDSSAFRKFVHFGVPFLVWVDNNGIVRAVTTTADANPENIQKFISGKHFEFRDISFKSRKSEKRIDPLQPLLINGNGGQDTDFQFRSILAEWKPGMGISSLPDIDFYSSLQVGRYQAVAASLFKLYKVAYFGSFMTPSEIYHWPILNLKDSSLFSGEGARKVLYNYGLEVPLARANRSELMRMMQNDLRNYFNFTVKIVDREVECYKLVVIDHQKAEKITKAAGPPESSWSAEKQVNIFNNIPISYVADVLVHKIGIARAFSYNDTGITGNVSLTIEADITNIDSIRIGLKKIGLDLVNGRKMMKVLVISDDK
ncbi:TlpA disulfide reductase family protein [uncultured Chitinophaga sp.]|uniref:TlpA family protein disulfide reductase n=1 Tax=uncultured Chitinophaga sp. TaxID=339340 RepID=UPI0025EE2F6E|nr:TlpA disulfide reductase family protein [uncultured Chitinophaga sp.]